MAHALQLQLHNQSNDANNAEVLVFQKRSSSALSAEAPSSGTVVKLRLVNQSKETESADIVVCQRLGDEAVAWRVIQYLAPGNYHPFTFSSALEVAASDSYGNFTPAYPWQPGDVWHMVRESVGDVLRLSTEKCPDPEAVEIVNELPEGSINANVLRDGLVTATMTSLFPSQKALFKLPRSIYIGVASGAVQGQLMDSAILSSINTELSLVGIASADIVMTGGGSEPFKFTLQNEKAG